MYAKLGWARLMQKSLPRILKQCILYVVFDRKNPSAEWSSSGENLWLSNTELSLLCAFRPSMGQNSQVGHGTPLAGLVVSPHRVVIIVLALLWKGLQLGSMHKKEGCHIPCLPLYAQWKDQQNGENSLLGKGRAPSSSCHVTLSPHSTSCHVFIPQWVMGCVSWI